MAVSLPVLAIAATVAGTAVSAYGAYSSSQASAQASAYQAQVARNNSIVAQQNAQAATKAGQEAATTASLKARNQLGEATAALAASGVDVSSGSAADVQTTEREYGRLDTQQTVQNAALNAYGYRTQATNYTAQAGLDTAEATNAPVAGAISAGGDLLSGAGSLGSKWVQWQNQGVVS